ncbi:putative ribonuclease YeeF [compost metagenome]
MASTIFHRIECLANRWTPFSTSRHFRNLSPRGAASNFWWTVRTSVRTSKKASTGGTTTTCGAIPTSCWPAAEHDYIYETDSLGRIKEVKEDNLQLTSRDKRLPHKSNSPGKPDDDHAGHLIGDRFGGSPKLDNIVNQSRLTNTSTYKSLENQWAKALKEGKSVTVRIRPLYSGSSARPGSLRVDYVIDVQKSGANQ